MVPTSRKDFVGKRFLLKKNVEVHKSCLMVHMNWTKTIQTGDRILQIPLVPIKDSILCPVSAFKKICKLIPTTEESPLFVFPT